MFFQTHPKATHIASDTLGAINSHNSRAALSTLLRSFTGKVSRKEDNMLSVDVLRADEFIERHLVL